MKHIQSLWREDLSPLGREAAPNAAVGVSGRLNDCRGCFAADGDKSPRHKSLLVTEKLLLHILRKPPTLRPSNMRHQATSPCASAYNCARIRRLVHLGSHRYFDSRHCPSVIGFSSSISKMFIAPFSQVFLHSMVAVRRAPSGAPVSWIPGLLTCVQLPLSSFSSEWVAAPTQGSKKHVQEHSESP